MKPSSSGARNSAICTSGFVQSIRARAAIGLKTETDGLRTRQSRASVQSVAVLTSGNVIAAKSSLGGEATASILERGGPVGARILAGLLSHRGTRRLILNSWGALRPWSFLSALIQPAKQSSCVKFILFSPHVLSFTALHDSNMQQRNVRDHE